MADSLSEEGRGEIEAVARRHEVPVDAAVAVMVALRRAGGRQAQFSHSALGGMGQWSRGGGTMIGDMFNHSLRTKVEQLCNELAERSGEARLFAVEADASGGEWWPRDLGAPSAAGSQNEQAYACFPQSRRVAVRDGGGVRIFDTGDHRITGVSQQQGRGRDLVFTGPHGQVAARDLRLVEGAKDWPTSGPGETGSENARGPGVGRAKRDGGSAQDVLALLERLHDLHGKGVLTEAEFADKKKELLTRL